MFNSKVHDRRFKITCGLFLGVTKRKPLLSKDNMEAGVQRLKLLLNKLQDLCTDVPWTGPKGDS